MNRNPHTVCLVAQVPCSLPEGVFAVTVTLAGAAMPGPGRQNTRKRERLKTGGTTAGACSHAGGCFPAQ